MTICFNRTKIGLATAAMTAALVLLGAGCESGPVGDGSGVGAGNGVGGGVGNFGGGLVGDVDNDICAEFTPDFVYSATGKPVVRVEPSKISGVFACDYYFEYRDDFYTMPNGSKYPGGPHIAIVLDNLSVQKQKEGVEYLGGKIETDERIKMEHYIVRRSKDNSVWGVHLVINPNRFVWTDSLNKGLTDEEIIEFGVKMAEKIQRKLSFDIKKNPIDLSVGGDAAATDAAATSGDQEAQARQFFELIGAGKADEAVAMMDTTDQMKQAWAKNFGTVTKLEVKSAEPTFQEEWTATRQVFKFVLKASVTPQGVEWGWENGDNWRWITLEKKGEQWRVTEIANNP